MGQKNIYWFHFDSVSSNLYTEYCPFKLIGLFSEIWRRIWYSEHLLSEQLVRNRYNRRQSWMPNYFLCICTRCMLPSLFKFISFFCGQAYTHSIHSEPVLTHTKQASMHGDWQAKRQVGRHKARLAGIGVGWDRKAYWQVSRNEARLTGIESGWQAYR